MTRSHFLAVGLAALCALGLPAGAQAGVDFGREQVFQADGLVSPPIPADLNGDKKVDVVAPYAFTPTIALPDPASKGILVILGDGKGSGTAHNQALGTALTSVTVGDFNGDGKQDVVGTFDDGNGNAGVETLLGDGAGGFSESSHSAAGAHPTEIVRADFNGDGKLDVAAIDRGTNDISVLLGTGSGSFGSPSTVVIASPPTSLGGFDVNGDNKVDLVVTTLAGATVRFGNGAGAFPNGSPVTIPGGGNDAVVRDVNGDHRVDLIVVTTSTNSFSVALGNASGGFTAGAPVAAGTAPRRVSAADFDEDGKVDLGIFGEASGAGTFGVYRGNGHGVFAGFATFPTGRVGGFVADFNADKVPDIAAGAGPVAGGPQSRETVSLKLNVPIVAGGSLNFGTQVARHASLPKTVTLTNTGAPALHVTSRSFTGTGRKDYQVLIDTCTNKTIAPKKTCRMMVRFVPEGLGTRDAALVLADDTADGATTFTLEGKGKRNPGVGIRHRTLRLDSHGSVHLRVSCPGPRSCKGELSVRSSKAIVLHGSSSPHHVTVARKQFRLFVGDRKTVALHVRSTAKGIVTRRGSLRVKVRASKQGAFVTRVSFTTTLRKKRR